MPFVAVQAPTGQLSVSTKSIERQQYDLDHAEPEPAQGFAERDEYGEEYLEDRDKQVHVSPTENVEQVIERYRVHQNQGLMWSAARVGPPAVVDGSR